MRARRRSLVGPSLLDMNENSADYRIYLRRRRRPPRLQDCHWMM